MKIIFKIIFSVTLFSISVFSDFRMGAGTSSLTSGRNIPGGYLLIGSQGFSVSAFTVGYKTSNQYYSGYIGSFQINLSPGKYFFGTLTAGYGLGVHYARRGLLLKSWEKEQTRETLTAGPLIKVHWEFFPLMFFGIEGLVGLNPKYAYAHVLMNVQGIAYGILGFRF